jgi:hypothetical protein
LATPATPDRRLLAPLFESAVLLVLGAALNVLAFADDPGFVSLTPHPTLFVAVLITARYGLNAGIQAALLGAVVYATLLLGLADVPTFLYLLAAPYATPLVVLLPTTVLLGLVVQRHLDRLTKSETHATALAEENARLAHEQSKLRDVNVELAGKVTGAEGTMSTLYRFARELNVKQVDDIYRGLAGLLEEVIEAERVSVWTVNAEAPGGLSLATRSGDPGAEAAGGAEPPPFSPTPGLDRRFDDAGVLALHDVPEEERTDALPYLVGKIAGGRGGDVVAYLTVDRLPFSRYNPETIRLFAMVVDWASTSVGNALPRAVAPTLVAVATPPPLPAPLPPPVPAPAAAAPPARAATPVPVPTSMPTPPPAPTVSVIASRKSPSGELAHLLADAQSVVAGAASARRSSPPPPPGAPGRVQLSERPRPEPPSPSDQGPNSPREARTGPQEVPKRSEAEGGAEGSAERSRVRPGQLEEALDRATLANAPLRALLGEIAGYLSTQPKKSDS